MNYSILHNITIKKKHYLQKNRNIYNFIDINVCNSNLFDIENILLIYADHYGPPFNPAHIFSDILETSIFVCNNNISQLYILLVNTDIVPIIWCEYLWNKFGILKIMKTEETINIKNCFFLEKKGYLWNEDWKKTIKVVPEFKLFRNYWLNNFESKKYIKETVNITVIDRKKNRIIKNIDELISLVDREKYEINIVQLELYTFEEQLNIIVNTDILLGFHGGGLAWLLFLPIGAKVIEILPIMTQFKDNRYYDVPYQFHNACKWCNISYFSAISDNETAAWDGLVNYLRPVDYKDEHNISTKDINKIMDFIKYK